MDEAVRTRTAAKSRLTRSANKLKELLDDDVIDFVQISEEKSEFEIRLKSYDDAQRAVELLITDDLELEASIETSEDFREEKRSTFIEVQRTLETKAELTSSTSSVHEDIPPVQPRREKVNARLPKIELPRFRGDPSNWQPFWDKFLAIVDGSDLSPVNKFSYLQSLLQDEALACVAGFSLTDDNYESAKALLQKRFGSKEKIIFSHIQKLLSISQSKSNNLWSLYDQVQASVRSLENLGIRGDTYGVILTPMILHQLPSHIRLEWARSSEDKEGNLDFLLEFLFGEIQRRERSQVFSGESQQVLKEKRKTVQTVSSLVVNEQTKIKCAFCYRNHYSDKCELISGLSHEQRKEKVKALRLCFKCLGGHTAKNCDKKCYYCKGPHHSVLHIHNGRKQSVDGSSPADLSTVNSSKHPDQVNMFVAASDSSSFRGGADSGDTTPGILYSHSGTFNTLMQIVQTKIGEQKVTVLFDSGSDRSFVKSSTAAKLGLQPVKKECLSLSSFGGYEQSNNDCNVFSLKIGNTDLKLLGIQRITAPLYRAAVPKNIVDIIGKIPVRENLAKDNVLHVDILIGLDFYWEMIINGSTKIIETTSLVAQESKLGWFVSGSYNVSKANKEVTALFCNSNVEPSECTIRKCWELDSIGIDGEESNELLGSKVLNDFTKEIKMNGDRYQVGLPWKSEAHKEMLVNNICIAQKRLASLTLKLNSNPGLRDRYNAVFDDLEGQGIIEEVSLNEPNVNPVFYLPHRPIVRESSQTTKVRPVFDGSVKSLSGVSLNDCLDVGPKLIPDLLKVLLRFRRWQFGLTADITKAFLQIELRPEDRDVHRFLLNKNEKVRHMRFTRVTFGNSASPFLLNATIKFHLSKFEEDKTIRELKQNLYVDDWLSGADDEKELMEMMVKSEQILKEGSFPLTKWASNSPQVREKLKRLSECDQKETQKVLGMVWNTAADCFLFETCHEVSGLLFTKRKLLGLIARQFDPLGLLTPYTVSLKILFQDVWRAGHDWDTPLPDDVQDEIEGWVEGLGKINKWNIPRRITRQSWTGQKNSELAVFVDASEKAYGCCIYMKTFNENGPYVTLVTSKVRVAPLKRVTLPRLELLSALLGARLLNFVISALELPEDIPYTCWTDSKIAEGWIKGESSRWKQFIRNRVVEIQNLTSPSCWKHVPGKENPADLLTRGVTSNLLTQSDLWLHGPHWLLFYTSQPAVGTMLQDFADDEEMVFEERLSTVPVCSLAPQMTTLVDYERFSSFGKLVRVIALVLKFIRKLKKYPSPTGKSFALDENIGNARKVLLKDIQGRFYSSEIKDLKVNGTVGRNSSLLSLSPFLDSEGIIRIRGRLGHDPSLLYDEKHPVVMPKCHASYLLVRSQHELMKHVGVGTLVSALRNEYWIVSVRTLAKKVLGRCIQCRRHDSRAMDQVTAPLPKDRLTQAPPFSVIGIDHAGPLYCCDTGEEKLYILLFTCAVTRAVHLELVSSLNLEDFLLAFRRFVSRRALPSIVYSDNAKTFKAASLLIQKQFSHVTIHWKFICPLSPSWGGWWERLVRSVKSCLRKSVGRKSLNRIELETTLQEVEACINSRPLTQLDELGTTLSPSHFLIGRGTPLTSHELETFQQVVNLSAKKEYENSITDKFWELWKRDYIRNLPPLKSKKINNRLKINSVVLIRDQNLQKMAWPLGVVTKLHRGLDGLVRAVEIKTAKGTFTRSIQHLTLLEIDHLDSSGNEESPFPLDPSPDPKNNSSDNLDPDRLKPDGDYVTQKSSFSTSRFGRKVKQRDILDL